MSYRLMSYRLLKSFSVVLVVLFATTSAWAQQKIRMQTAVPTASIYFELLKRYADRVDKMSGGKIKIEVLPDGAIVPAFEILDAVDKGIVEAGYAWTHYWSGKHPAAGLFSNPMAGAAPALISCPSSPGFMRAAATSCSTNYTAMF